MTVLLHGRCIFSFTESRQVGVFHIQWCVLKPNANDTTKDVKHINIWHKFNLIIKWGMSPSAVFVHRKKFPGITKIKNSLDITSTATTLASTNGNRSTQVCRRWSNYTFILDLTSGFNGLGIANCKTRSETFKLRDLMGLMLTLTRSGLFCCSAKWYPNRNCKIEGLQAPLLSNQISLIYGSRIK